MRVTSSRVNRPKPRRLDQQQASIAMRMLSGILRRRTRPRRGREPSASPAAQAEFNATM
jgi:hypothetical protein